MLCMIFLVWLRNGSNPADINRFRSHTGLVFPKILIYIKQTPPNYQFSFLFSESSIYATPIFLPPSKGLLTASLDGTVACLEADSGDITWRLELGRPVFANPLYDEVLNCVYVCCVDCNVYAGKFYVVFVSYICV